ncbi:hypothetical protein QCA50_017361 [Cerrena zonata]|uniref:BTB domain-containing protein n=1 Tax=Cerrena zonata TaxID=2478898 RepID=A0AAW0FJD3_9APHY
MSQVSKDQSGKVKYASKGKERDNGFYLEHIVFLVDEVLFKVPEMLLTAESAFFRKLLKETNEEGHTDEKPIPLKDVEADEFRALLKCLLPSSLHGEPSSKKMSTSDWISVLKLSKRWEMTKTTQTAIQKVLEGLKADPIQRILLAEQYGISGWRLDAYAQLASRREPLSAKEASSLGYERAFKIIHMRERAYEQIFSAGCDDCKKQRSVE